MSLGFFNYLNSFPIYEGLGTETDLSFEINTPLKIGQKILDNSFQEN